MPSDRKSIVGSRRVAPTEPRLGPTDPAQRAEISIYLRPLGSASSSAATRSSMRSAREKTMQRSFDLVATFAEAHGLAVIERHPGRRLLKVAGSIAVLEEAFGTHLEMFDHPHGAFRGRSGELTAPAEVAEVVEAVLGLDQRPAATAKSVRLMTADAATAGNLPNAVTKLYGFPTTPKHGAGQCIAIIELGGGVSAADTKAAFKAMSLAPPKVIAVLVDHASNKPGADPDADGEVALDVQVAGAGAPGARLAVYFAPNTDQGFVDAITQAAHDDANRPGVMSISWGGPGSGWTQQAVTAMSSAFQDATQLGLSIFAASGDGLATDGQADGRAHVDFPASSPWVVACGGTRLGADGSTKEETVWNVDGAGTGGGVSDLFAVPSYQQTLKLPSSANGDGRLGRGVPDVAGDADPNTGYRVIVDGRAEVIGGTSAVAPLWAGLFALINERVGKSIGDPHAALYAHPKVFNDIRKGGNRSGGVGYDAIPGWDACTGLGTPKAQAVAALFGPAK